MMDKRVMLGLVEKVVLIGDNGSSKELVGRIDTGATVSSIDLDLANKMNLKRIDKFKIVKSASGIEKRPLVIAKIKVGGQMIEEKFNLADRSHMTYQVLIGQNILKKGDFLVDPKKEGQ